MNRTHSPLGGRTTTFGSDPARSLRTPSKLMRAAGRVQWLTERSFDQLEQRQMLFALAAPLGGRVAQIDFAYMAPFLQRQVPAFTAHPRETYDFEYPNPPVPAPPPGAGYLIPNGSIFPEDTARPPLLPPTIPDNPATAQDFPSLQVQHTGFGGTPPLLTQAGAVASSTTAPLQPPGAGASDEDWEMFTPLTGARTVTFSFSTFAGPTDLRIMRAFEFKVVQINADFGTAPNTIAMPATTTFNADLVRIQLLFEGQIVATFDNQGTDLVLRDPANPNIDAVIAVTDQNPIIETYRLQRPGLIADFDQVVFSTVGGGDTFTLLDITGEFPAGRFNTWVEDLAFGARAVIAGPNNGVLDTAPGVSQTHPPVGRTALEIFDNDTGVLNRRLTSPTTFASNVRLTHANYAVGAEPQMVAGQGGGANRALGFTLAGTQTFSFTFRDARGNARPMTQFSFATPNGGAGGQMLDAGTQIELIRNGQVVRTYTQADFEGQDIRVDNLDAGDPNAINQFIYVLDTVTLSANFHATYDGRVAPDGFGAAFDEIRFSRVDGLGTDAGGILIDRVAPFAPAMVEIFDLYGRPMLPTLASTRRDSELNPIASSAIDHNDDGVPDYNDGIGRIIISNGDATTNFSIYGGRPVYDADTDDWTLELVDSTLGNFDDFEDAGFGFIRDTQNPQDFLGLPPGPGSVLIGSPFFRNNTNSVTYHGVNVRIDPQAEVLSSLPRHGNGTAAASFADAAPVTNPQVAVGLSNAGDFSNPHVGFSTPAGMSVGAITVHGAVFGQNNFGGAVQRFNVGTFLGSLTVNGDIGTFASASDSGLYFVRPQNTNPPDDSRGVVAVGSTINILRTAGSMYFGARNASRVTIFQDVNNPNLGRLSFITYSELEVIPGFQGAQMPEVVWNGAVIGAGAVNNAHLGVQPLLFGQRGYRNDTMQGAEYVGNAGSFTTITGTLGNFNDLQGQDFQDWYAFSARGDRNVLMDVVFDSGPTAQSPDWFAVEIRSGTGEILHQHETPLVGRDRIPGSQASIRVNFDPPQDDVYYIHVIIGRIDGSAASVQPYSITLTGMASTGSGMVSVVGNSFSFLEVRSSLGLLRTGSGIVGDAGEDTDISNGAIDTIETADDFLETHGLSFLIQGDLYGATFGSDIITPGLYTVSGNLGSFRVGTFYRIGATSDLTPHGDVLSLFLDVGGRIGTIEVLGDMTGDREEYLGGGFGPGGPVRIRSGLVQGQNGSINEIFIAGVMYGDQTFITLTGANSRLVSLTVVGGILLGAPTITAPGGVGPIETPFTPQARPGITFNPDAFRTPLFFDAPLSFTASSGITYTIRITGGNASQASFGSITLFPVSGAPGQAISRIDVTLVGGANLYITTTSPGKLDIGEIAVNTAPPFVGFARTSDILISGSGEVDVGRVIQPLLGVANFGKIANTTVNGDILLIDVFGVNQVVVNGNLGRTEDPTRRGRLVDAQVRTAVTGTGSDLIPIDQNFMGLEWNGRLISLPKDPIALGAQPAHLIGSPIDGRLAGLVVRTGNVDRVSVNGAVSDVMLLDPDLTQGILRSLVVNADGITGSTGFDGIVGNILVNHAITINVGQGLRGNLGNGLPEASITAAGHIGTIIGSARNGVSPIISGLIVAGNSGPAPRGIQTGINNISITDGLIDKAFISVGVAGSFFRSPVLFAIRSAAPGDVPDSRGTIRAMNLTRTPLFRSELFADNVGNVNIRGAAFDASIIDAALTVGTIRADRFINSTRDGEVLEYRFAQIFGGLSIGGIATNGGGDISDLFVITNGNLQGGITARNITRLDLEVRNTMGAVKATNDIRSSRVSVGRLATLSAGGDIRSSTFDVAGPVGSVSAKGEITNTAITSVGPDGRINSISAGSNIDGTFTASGPISKISSARGSISGSIITTDATDGNVANINAAGDVAVTFNLAKNLGTVRAGGNLGTRPAADGTRDVIDVGGTIGTLTAGGQLYADVRSGSTIKSVTIGRVSATPANDLVGDGSVTAYGRINAFTVTGDFNGSVISYSGGIGSFRITNGSFRLGNDDDASGTIEDSERNRIAAFDGDITSVTIANGSLFGDVLAPDGNIKTVSVSGSGPFGRIGIDPTLSTTVAVTGDALRNQLPPGTLSTGGFGGTAAINGPRIFAGRDITNVTAAGGMFEAGIWAGRNVGSVTVGSVNTDGLGALADSTFVAAGDSVNNVTVRGLARGLTVVGGVSALGTDNRVGGVAGAADTLKSGRVVNVSAGAGSDTLSVVAGVNAGTDGVYNTADGDNSETAVPGLSAIGTVRVTGGAIVATTAFTDASIGAATTAGITRSTGALPADARTFTGATGGFATVPTGGLAVTTTSGETATITFTGPGQAFWDAANNRVVLISSTSGSTLRVDPTGATTTLTNFGIVSNDDASLGSLIINARLASATASDTADRNSRVFIDGTINNLQVAGANITADAALAGSGILAAGEQISTARIGNAGTTAAPAAANQFRLESGAAINNLTVNGDFGTSSASRVDAITLGSVTVNGAARGVVSSSRDITSFRATGAINGGRVRAGNNIGTVRAAAASNLARITAGGNINTVNITGDATDTTIYAGTDLGTDGTFGGVGSAADRVSNGNINSVTVGGNFGRSDVAAGVARGPDGFLNTADDVVADGRSSITNVRISGQQVGSTVNSQRYAVISNGSVGATKVGATTVGSNSIGNFSKVALTNKPTPILVTDIRVNERAPRLFSARLSFSEKLDVSTIAAALTVSEVRGVASLQSFVPLVQGVDYTFRFEAASNTLVIDFSEDLAARNLIGHTTGALASNGVYRFELDAAILRGATTNSRLDGNGDGAITGDADDYSEDAVVGDAGDRLFSGRAFTNIETAVDLYGPVSLDVLMDRNRNSDGLPDTNRQYTLRGALGDHPDINTGNFAAGGDIDVYSLTLRAGQILQLGALTGDAQFADVAIVDSEGNPLFSLSGGVVNPTVLRGLGNNDPAATQISLLAQISGTYNIIVLTSAANLVQFNPFGFADILDPTSAAGPQSTAGTTGAYGLPIRIFDDGDSGFFGGLPAQDADIPDANFPVPNDFIGGDNVFDTDDDQPFFVANDANPANPQFFFQVFAGADNILGTADDIVLGSNGVGVFATRTAGVNGTFGDGDDVFTVTRTVLAGAAPVDPDGVGAANAVPIPDDFRGADNTFNTADDLAAVTRTATAGPDFTYILLAGPDNIRGTADDTVFGSNGQGINSTRTAGNDGIFNTVDDVVRLTTDSGNGSTVMNAVFTPSDFAGVDGVLGNADDLASITVGDYIFTLGRGANNRFDGNGAVGARSDDVVTGIRTAQAATGRIVSTRTAGADGIFGTGDDVFTSTADAAIGAPGASGVPLSGQADVDVYHLNGGAPIAAGTRLRATLKVTEIGGNLGLLLPVQEVFGNAVTFSAIDNRGLVQFALFDTSLATDISNANLVAAPDKVLGLAGQVASQVTDGVTTYGYDANGDFFMEFAVPARLDDPSRAGTFALYIQGVVRSDYQLEVITSGTLPLPAEPRTQNVLIEVTGGAVSWLEANPYTPTLLGAFDPGVSGFTGLLGLGNQPAAEFFVTQIVANLQAIFTAAGMNVIISTNAADFEGEDFSTVYLTGSEAPTAFVGSLGFGATQGVDIFNADRNDQAVIFLTQLNVLGNIPGNEGAVNLTNQLTAAIGRRIGELIGLRATANTGPGAQTDIMAANSPFLTLQDGQVYAFLNTSRPLARPGSTLTSTQFFLGNQNSIALLDRIFGNP